MKQTHLHRLESILEQQKARVRMRHRVAVEIFAGSWTAFFGGRCRDFPTMEEASDYLTDKGVDPVIIIDV